MKTFIKVNFLKTSYIYFRRMSDVPGACVPVCTWYDSDWSILEIQIF
jgi:hypothetical protein